MCMRVCIHVRDCEYGPFVFLSPQMRFFMMFGDNVSRSSSWPKNVACFFAVSCVRCFTVVCHPCLGSGMPS